MKKLFLAAIAIALVIVGSTGCFGGDAAPPGTEATDNNPDGSSAEASENTSEGGNTDTTVNRTSDNVLFFYTAQNKIYEEEENFEKLIGQYIRKKFPDIQIKHVHWNDGTRYEDLIAKGTIPDIVLEQVRRNTTRMIVRFGMEYDMSDLIKKYNFDTGALDPAMLGVSKLASDGKLYSLPFENDEFVLVYNKDIFDKYGQDYPHVGMTYEEAYELAKTMTRQDGDVTYKGWQQHPSHYMMYNQLSEPALDPNDDKASLTTDTWVKIVDNMRRFYEIPGNQFTSTSEFPRGRMAVSVDTLENVTKWSREYPDLNFSFGAVPVFPEAPNSKYMPNLNGLFITKQSNKKDLAFQVISYLLSEEVQMARAKDALIGPMMNETVVQAFAQNVPELQGKDVQNVFALKPAVPKARKPGLTFINPNVWGVFQNHIFEESKDTPTALRLIEEAMTQQIDETIQLKEAGGDWWKYQ
ncbi:ABC transporter substrate-binding protein [Paenibacillus alkalitolerans]|uniref:ABC transporter substrate-binding protein n=1 Tax=Paenibacillus alkalitolerans TaxID=2799335 RepID=UPI0018F6E3D2|nr:extracellular solute-binding protein [Paenibacillus alkalitolerans]